MMAKTKTIPTRLCPECKTRMSYVRDIEIRGITGMQGEKIRGWKCKCGVEQSDPDDMKMILDLSNAIIKGATLFKSGNSWAIRLPAELVRGLSLKPNSKFDISVDIEKKYITLSLKIDLSSVTPWDPNWKIQPTE